jgi:polyribonucleotide nucleotidyltransferase
MSSIIKEVKVGNKTIRLEFQKYAKQANGSVMVTCGETQVLVTACAANQAKEGQDFFPLSVDYIEKYYAAGRIPGGFVKRETKPSDRETLMSRVIDRPIRPCFPKGFLCETHVVATVVSVDFENHPVPLALLGASTALMISDIPFNGPVASLRIGLKNGEFVLDPDEINEGDLDLNIAANPDAVLMVEAGANFLSESQMLDAISYAHDLMRPLFEMQLEIQREIGKPKRALPEKSLNTDLYNKVEQAASEPLFNAFAIRSKLERNKTIDNLKDSIVAQFSSEENGEDAEKVEAAFEKFHSVAMRKLILEERKRIDGRSLTDIRPISCEVGVLKRAHGSALFTRGETQALGVVTLGSGDDEQRLDTVLTPGVTKKFMLHYNFPPYSVGEARPLRSPGRREIGHGALAERSLARVMPREEVFGYTVRLVSEVLESNGSSSMATVCAGTMALFHAGVPLIKPVAGIAMGLVKEGDNYAVLSDILGDEDHLGDMDFKVTGSEDGITALQMDIKIGGLSKNILAEALEQAKQGRKHILKHLTDTISGPSDISEHAPRIFQMKVKTDKIKDLIGPGGKTIKSIVARCNVKIDVDDNGVLNIVAPSGKEAESAKKMIRSVTSDPEVGAICLGKVTRILEFGAFVEIKPGLEGLLHVSQLEDHRVERVTDVLREGEEVLVKILDVDRQGKIKLSRKEALGKKPTIQNVF